MKLMFLQLDHRGYCNRTSVLSYSNNVSYSLTLPPPNYPSAAPYASLTKLFHKFIKEKSIHSKLLKQLLYPEYLNKMNLSLVKIRHHKTECIIMTKTSACRFSIVNCDSESDTDSDSDVEKMPRQNAIDNDSSDDESSSSSNPFGYIRYYNPQTGSRNEVETKYESFIDYGEPVTVSEPQMVNEEPRKVSVLVTSTAKVQLVHQISESSEASSLVAPKNCLACEDLRNLDENLPVLSLNTRKPYVPLTRQSLPTKFVGNKFSESSLTTIEIPHWQSNSDNQLNCRSKCGIGQQILDTGSCSTTTHSSSLDLEVNTLPLPDNIVAELLYNYDPAPANIDRSESVESDKSFKTVIKPPTVFQNDTKNSHSDEVLNLSLENIGFKRHSINSDKPKRRSSVHVHRTNDAKTLRRCVSSHFVRISHPSDGCPNTACCLEMCQSPRSSDSGMAGSCNLNSPDFAGNEQGHCSVDITSELQKFGLLDENLSLSEIEARTFNSQCQCSSPFNSTPRTSCQTSVSENVLTGSHDSMRTTSVTSMDIALTQPWEVDSKAHSTLTHVTPKMLETELPQCVEAWEPAQKSKSLDSLNTSPNVACNVDDQDKGQIYKSGLYAHWWLKAKIPASVVKGIYKDTRPTNTGKGVLCINVWNDP